MAIADTISSMYENVGEVYDTITNVDVNAGKNLFDKSTITENTYIEENGNTGSSQVTNLSDYIGVKPNTSYTLSYDYSTLLNSNQRNIIYYDENKTYISGLIYLPTNRTNTITTPNNAKYIRFSYDKNCYSIMLNEGSTSLPYEPYTDTPTYKNIENIPKVIRNSYLEIMNNGIDKIWNNWEKVEGTGESLSLNSTEEAPMKIDLKGNTSQEGTPTPETPQDIQVVSGDNSIDVCGKNLFDINSCPILEYAFYNGNGNPVSWSGTCGIREYIKLEENLTYTIKYNSSSNFLICFYDKNKTYLSQLTKASGGNFTMPSTAKYIRFGINTAIANVEWCQIEKGTTATTYEAYKGASYPISLGNIELCKIGTYQDYFYKDSGKWYLHKEIGKVVLNGSESGWNYAIRQDRTTRFFTKTYSNEILTNNTAVANELSNYFKVGNPYTSLQNTIWLYKSGTNTILRVGFDNQDMTTPSQFTTWLSTHNTELYYPLATPTTTEITDSTLISQLEALNGARSYTTQTNISQENNDKPFIISASALMSLKYIFGNLETRVAELEG